MLPTKFRFIWSSDFREEKKKKSSNQKQELPVAAMFVNESEQTEHSDWLISKKSSPLKPLRPKKKCVCLWSPERP
jgi:hypothetical protein